MIQRVELDGVLNNETYPILEGGKLLGDDWKVWAYQEQKMAEGVARSKFEYWSYLVRVGVERQLPIDLEKYARNKGWS